MRNSVNSVLYSTKFVSGTVHHWYQLLVLGPKHAKKTNFFKQEKNCFIFTLWYKKSSTNTRTNTFNLMEFGQVSGIQSLISENLHTKMPSIKCLINVKFVCPRSGSPFYRVTYFMKWVTTSRTFIVHWYCVSKKSCPV